jgi:hypothetical protein
MPKRDYSKGRVYRLVCKNTGLQYIGSTINTFPKRLSKHVYDAKNRKDCTSNTIIDNGNYEILLVEKYPCNDKYELKVREQYWIDILDCVNKNAAYRSPEYWKEYYQQYREEHKDEKIEYNQKYYEENQDEILDQKKDYYQENREKILEYKAQYRAENQEKIKESKVKDYQKNKDKIAEKNKTKITCECGTEVTLGALWNHKQTKKHKDNLN